MSFLSFLLLLSVYLKYRSVSNLLMCPTKFRIYLNSTCFTTIMFNAPSVVSRLQCRTNLLLPLLMRSTFNICRKPGLNEQWQVQRTRIFSKIRHFYESSHLPFRFLYFKTNSFILEIF